jgi:hypothetical protein
LYEMSATNDPILHNRRGSRWLSLARAGWVVLTVLALSLVLAGLPWRFFALLEGYQRSLSGTGISASAAASYAILLTTLVVLVHIALATLVFLRAPRDRVALLVAVTLSANGALLPLAFLYGEMVLPPAWRLLVDGVACIGLISSILTVYLFPDGRFVPRWTLPLAAIWALASPLAVLAPGETINFVRWPLLLQSAVLLTWVVTGLYAQVYRFTEVSDLTQRQQAKWAASGLLAAALTPLVYFLSFAVLPSMELESLPNQLVNRFGSALFTLPALGGLIGMTLLALGMMVFPASFAVAVLRYRLWDIDRLISRTVAYTLLTATLSLLYFGIVVVLQQLFGSRVGRTSPLVIVVSTLAIAALFNPLRRRIQTDIDRRFYRRKYDAAQILARFAVTARNEVDLDQLLAELCRVIDETLQPTHVSISLLDRPGAPAARHQHSDRLASSDHVHDA